MSIICGKEAKMKTIGLITIGQSPRTDVTEDIGAFFSEEVTVLEAGALDHITEAELQDMRPEGNETALVSRMRDGRQVIFAEKHILRLLQQCVTELQDKGADAILFLCTGRFPSFEADIPLIFPYDILRALFPVLGGKRSLTVLVPDKLQVEEAEKDWGNYAEKVQAIAVSPYSSMETLLETLSNHEIEGDMIIMDCIGYSCEMKEAVAKLSGKPVLLPRTLAARVAIEML